jgi:hypothetical protein
MRDEKFWASLNSATPPISMNEPEKPEEQKLSDFHHDFLVRYMEYELPRQQKVAERLHRQGSDAVEASNRPEDVKTRPLPS